MGRGDGIAVTYPMVNQGGGYPSRPSPLMNL